MRIGGYHTTSAIARKRVSGNLAYLREKSGLSLRKVADKLGVALSSYERWEGSVNLPSPENLKNLAGFFDVSIEDLTEGDCSRLR